MYITGKCIVYMPHVHVHVYVHSTVITSSVLKLHAQVTTYCTYYTTTALPTVC